MRDRAMQALYLLALEPVTETQADPNSYGFRRERSTADAIEQCFKIFSRRKCSPEWVLEADIRACFDQISHDWLLKHAPMDKVILKQWLGAVYIEKGASHQTEAGTPQGGIISPALANLTLDGLEGELRKRFRHKDTNKPSTGVNYVRYADDVRRRKAMQEETQERANAREKRYKAPTLSRPGNRLGSVAWWAKA